MRDNFSNESMRLINFFFVSLIFVTFKLSHLVCDTNSGGVILPTPFFIFLNLHSLILLEHHCYHLHFPSKHIQTLNQIPYIQPSINSSLSLSFNKFHKKKKEKPLKIHLQPLCKWVYITSHLLYLPKISHIFSSLHSSRMLEK